MQQSDVLGREAAGLVERLEGADDALRRAVQRHAQDAARLIAGLLPDAAKQTRIVQRVVDENDLVALDARPDQAMAGRDADRLHAMGDPCPHLASSGIRHPDAAAVGRQEVARHVGDQHEQTVQVLFLPDSCRVVEDDARNADLILQRNHRSRLFLQTTGRFATAGRQGYQSLAIRTFPLEVCALIGGPPWPMRPSSEVLLKCELVTS